jgi:hypothetical protein
MKIPWRYQGIPGDILYKGDTRRDTREIQLEIPRDLPRQLASPASHQLKPQDQASVHFKTNKSQFTDILATSNSCP